MEWGASWGVAGVATETCVCVGRGWCGVGCDYESEGERLRRVHCAWDS